MDGMYCALGLLDAHGSLRLITDRVYADDALCLALACRALRDSVWASYAHAWPHVRLDNSRLRTSYAAAVAAVARAEWAWQLL